MSLNPLSPVCWISSSLWPWGALPWVRTQVHVTKCRSARPGPWSGLEYRGRKQSDQKEAEEVVLMEPWQNAPQAASLDGSSQLSEKALREAWVPSPMGSAKRTGGVAVPSLLDLSLILGLSHSVRELCNSPWPLSNSCHNCQPLLPYQDQHHWLVLLGLWFCPEGASIRSKAVINTHNGQCWT